MATSLYGLLPSLSSAWLLPGGQVFTQFMLVVLVQNLGLGLFRTVIADASLLSKRQRGTGPVRLRHATAAWIAIAPPQYLILVALRVPPLVAAAAALALLFATWHDCTRYYAMHRGSLVVVFFSDMCRLSWVIFVLAVLQPTTLLSLIAGVGSTALPGAAVASLARRHSAETGAALTLRKLLPISRWQLVEFGVSQSQTTVPLLVLGGAGGGAMIGAFRLAQTLFGPVNLVSAALNTSLLVDTANTRSDTKVWGRVYQTSALTGSVAMVSAVGAIGLTFFDGVFPAVDHSSLRLALGVVGASTCAAAFVGPILTGNRVVARLRLVTQTRAFILFGTWAGFVAGYAVQGVTGSLITGFASIAAMTAVAGIVLLATVRRPKVPNVRYDRRKSNHRVKGHINDR